MSRPRNKPQQPQPRGNGPGPASTASRVRVRARAPKEGDPDWRPVGHDGKSRVRFARDDFDEDQMATLMRALGDGVALDVAARALGESVTGTQLRRYMQREPAFDAQVRETMAAGKLAYQDRLRMRSRGRATDAENPSDRMLEVELATHVPEYAHLRRDRLQVDGKVRHEFAIAFDPASLDALPIEERRKLRDILAALDGDIVVDGKARPARELTEGGGA